MWRNVEKTRIIPYEHIYVERTIGKTIMNHVKVQRCGVMLRAGTRLTPCEQRYKEILGRQDKSRELRAGTRLTPCEQRYKEILGRQDKSSGNVVTLWRNIEKARLMACYRY